MRRPREERTTFLCRGAFRPTAASATSFRDQGSAHEDRGAARSGQIVEQLREERGPDIGPESPLTTGLVLTVLANKNESKALREPVASMAEDLRPSPRRSRSRRARFTHAGAFGVEYLRRSSLWHFCPELQAALRAIARRGPEVPDEKAAVQELRRSDEGPRRREGLLARRARRYRGRAELGVAPALLLRAISVSSGGGAKAQRGAQPARRITARFLI